MRSYIFDKKYNSEYTWDTDKISIVDVEIILVSIGI